MKVVIQELDYDHAVAVMQLFKSLGIDPVFGNERIVLLNGRYINSNWQDAALALSKEIGIERNIKLEAENLEESRREEKSRKAQLKEALND